jgi:dienelactone hydrolase
MTEYIEYNYAVDPGRVYAAGFSAGGAFASVLAATYPDVFAAIGIGSGCEYAATPTCAGYKSADPQQAAQQAYKEMGSHARPMPFITFQGDQDTTVPPANADQLVQQWLTTDDLADDGTLNGSVPTRPAKTSFGWPRTGGESYTVRNYVDSHRAELAQYWVVRGMKHAWSGGDPSQQYSDPSGPDETAAMYAFFLGHTAPPHPRAIPATSATPAPAASATPLPAASSRPRPPAVSRPKFSRRRIVFAISGPGSVTLLLQHRITGHMARGVCVAGNGKRRACTKYATRAKITRTAAKARRMAITLPRRVHGHRLLPGRYRAVVTPADAAGHAGTSQTVEFVLR